jgi:tRNA A-37 threonylcarbamoyl transferase component Bud32
MKAHLVCCSLGIAPQLRGFRRVPGGWYMIVMDAIGDEFDYFHKPIAAHFEPMKEKIVALHQKGYVHGDVRDTNVMANVSLCYLILIGRARLATLDIP